MLAWRGSWSRPGVKGVPVVVTWKAWLLTGLQGPRRGCALRGRPGWDGGRGGGGCLLACTNRWQHSVCRLLAILLRVSCARGGRGRAAAATAAAVDHGSMTSAKVACTASRRQRQLPPWDCMLCPSPHPQGRPRTMRRQLMILTASQPVKATPAGRTRTHGRARRAPPCTWRKPKRVAAAAAAGGAVPPRPFQRVQTNVKQSAHINETLWPEAPVGGHAQKLDMEPVTLAAHNPGMMTEHSLDSKALVSAPRGSSPVPAAGSPARELGKRGPRPRRPREHARLVMQDEVLRGLSASGWPAAVEGGDQLPVGAEGSATASSFMQQLMRLSSLPAGSSVMGPQDATGYVERRLGCLCAGCTAQSAGCATRDQTDIHSPAAARGCGTSDRLTPPPGCAGTRGRA